MNNIMNFAQNMVRMNKNVPNTPWAQAAIQAILNGDQQDGEQLANNICQSMGVTKEQALEMAKQQRIIPF